MIASTMQTAKKFVQKLNGKQVSQLWVNNLVSRVNHPLKQLARQYHVSSRLSSHAIVQHRDIPGNTGQETFDFNAENAEKVKVILAKFPTNYKGSAVMPLLTLAQEQCGNWLPLAAMNRVAAICDLPRIRVYEVATFYSMYNRSPIGKYHIQLCGTTPCQLCGSEALIEAVEKHLGIKSGDTTPDGLFTLTEVECLGACANAPMIQVNNHEYYENLTPTTIINVIEQFRRGESPKVGPQNGQNVASGIMGKTSLFEDPTEPHKHFRSVEQIKQQLAQAAAKAATPASPAVPPPKN